MLKYWLKNRYGLPLNHTRFSNHFFDKLIYNNSEEGDSTDPFTCLSSDDDDSDYDPDAEQDDTNSGDDLNDEGTDNSESSDDDSWEDNLPDLNLHSDEDDGDIETVLFEKLSKFLYFT